MTFLLKVGLIFVLFWVNMAANNGQNMLFKMNDARNAKFYPNIFLDFSGEDVFPFPKCQIKKAFLDGQSWDINSCLAGPPYTNHRLSADSGLLHLSIMTNVRLLLTSALAPGWVWLSAEAVSLTEREMMSWAA